MLLKQSDRVRVNNRTCQVTVPWTTSLRQAARCRLPDALYAYIVCLGVDSQHATHVLGIAGSPDTRSQGLQDLESKGSAETNHAWIEAIDAELEWEAFSSLATDYEAQSRVDQLIQSSCNLNA